MIPKLIIRTLPIMSCNKITVVNPSSAVPVKYRYRDWMPSMTEAKNITKPNRETNCMGAPEKEVMFWTAYLVRLHTDHLETPISRSCTSNGRIVVLNPTQEDRARKKGARSGMIKSASIALRSSSLKSEARDISIPVALLIRL